MNRQEMSDYIQSTLRRHLAPLTNAPNALETREAIQQAVAWTLASLGDVPQPDFGVQVDDLGGGRMGIRFKASPDMVARMAASLYSEGRSHDDVTAWLDAHAPGFRSCLVEVSFAGHPGGEA